MLITRIEKIGKNRNKIYGEEGTVFILYAKEQKNFNIEEGKCLSEEQLSVIMEEILYKRAVSRSLYLLNAMDRTEHQLREKLIQNSYPTQVIDKVVLYLKQCKYLEDERYVRNYIEYRCEKKSKKQLIRELCQKGISQEYSSTLYDEICVDAEEAAIQAVIVKRGINLQEASKEELKKLYMHLARKGFSIEKIRGFLKIKGYEM